MSSNQPTSHILRADLSLSECAKQLEDKNALLLSSVFTSEILSFLQKISEGNYAQASILDGRSSEFRLTDVAKIMKIELIFNNPELLNDFSQILGTKITSTNQRVYYVDESCQHLEWHDDSHEKKNRIAALRVELSQEEYEGGDLLIKDVASGEISTFSNMKLGEGVLFKVKHGELLHMVTPIKGPHKRKSFILFLNA